jgi:hypothetical protein
MCTFRFAKVVRSEVHLLLMSKSFAMSGIMKLSIATDLPNDHLVVFRTKETLATGHFMSVINVLMQLRKVCNHPNLFDPRPTVSPFQMEGISYTTASQVLKALEYEPLKVNSTLSLHLDVDWGSYPRAVRIFSTSLSFSVG